MKKLFAFSLVVCMMLCFSTITASAEKNQSAAYGRSYGYGTWVSLTTTLQPIYSLTISVPKDNVKVYVDCDGYVCMNYGVNTKFAIGIDSVTEDQGTRRFYGLDDISATHQYSGVHISKVYVMNKGSHTIYFLGSLFNSGSASVNYMSISALMFETGAITPYVNEGVTEGNNGIAEDGTE